MASESGLDSCPQPHTKWAGGRVSVCPAARRGSAGLLACRDFGLFVSHCDGEPERAGDVARSGGHSRRTDDRCDRGKTDRVRLSAARVKPGRQVRLACRLWVYACLCGASPRMAPGARQVDAYGYFERQTLPRLEPHLGALARVTLASSAAADRPAGLASDEGERLALLVESHSVPAG